METPAGISMAQRTSGWRYALSLPGIYDLSQKLLGSTKYYRSLVAEHIRPKSGMRVLDVGCGPATILDHLSEEIDYVGIDLSPAYINAARSHYGKRGIFYCLSVEEIMDASDLADFDLVMGIGLLHHLADHQARRFFIAAEKSLDENGRCLTVDPCTVAGQHPFARLLIQMDRGQNVRAPKAYADLARTTFPRLTQKIDHEKLHVPYTHNIMECWKKK